MAEPLVSTEWLKNAHDKTSSGGKELIVLDTTWIPTMDGHEFYVKSHIPGSYHFDITACGTPTRELPRIIPELTKFQEYLRSFGICQNSHVVLYDRDDGGDILTCASDRTWWIFRVFGHESVSVLDGGLHKWQNEGYPVSSGDEKPKDPTGNILCKWNSNIIKSYAEMQKIVDENLSQIIDTRMEVHFTGSVPEPSEHTEIVLNDVKQPALKESEIVSGNMKNAKNISLFSLKKHKSPDHLSKEEYSKLFQNHGINLNQPITSTCYIGHTACLLALAAAVCGKRDTAVYPGSWTEWGQMAAKGNLKHNI